MTDTLFVNEIYLSLQGESTWSGLPCVFVRLTACNLRCSYCDTAYAFKEGDRRSVENVLKTINKLAAPFRPQSNCGLDFPIVEFTGGEPMLQPAILPLMTRLCDDGFTVLIETSGAHDISKIDSRVHRIMDLKCPSSGECARNLWSNIQHLKKSDELKFVVGTREDFHWVRTIIEEHRLNEICPILVSWVSPLQPHQIDQSLKSVPDKMTPMSRTELVEAILREALPVRFQIQAHKIIWPPDQRGV